MATKNRKVQLEIAADATGVEAAAQKAKDALGGIGEGAQKGAEKVDRATKSIISSIERATAVTKAGERGTAAFYEALANTRGVDAAALAPYIAQLKAAEVAQRAAAGGLDKMALSAKQTTAALRQVPMQFTDIVTSLAGGQSPLQVLLQQGGQLKDVFGGVGAAAKALGGYIMGLVNPFTVAAAAVGGIAYAYSKGAAESKAFEQTLIMSGRAAGVTAGQLSEMAASIDKLGGGTQAKAAEVLDTIAGIGNTGAVNMRRFASAIIEFERAGGPATEKMVEAFAELGKAPLQASIKLNESMNYLTRSTYEQIKSLEEQGRTTDAARAAQEAYASALESRAPEMTRNLGYVERSWRSIVDVSKEALDAILSVGRPGSGSTLEGQIAALQQRINANNLERQSTGDYGRAAIDKGNALLQTRLTMLSRQLALQTDAAAADAAATESVKARISFDKEREKYLGKQALMAKEIERFENLAVAAGYKRQDIEAEIGRIREKYASKTTGDNNAARELEAQADLLARLAGLTATYNNDVKRLNDLRKAGALTEEQYGEKVRELVALQPFAVKAEKDLADASKEKAKALKEANDAQERNLKGLDKTIEGHDKELAALQLELVELTRGKAARDEVIASRYEDAAAQAEQSAQLAYMGDFNEYERLVRIAAQLRELAAARRDVAAATSAKEAEDANAKASEKAQKEWEKASDQIGQSLADALMKGGKSAAEYIKGLFRTMVLRPVIQGAIQPVANGVLGVLGMSGGATGAGGNSYLQGAGAVNTMWGLGSKAYGAMGGSTAAFGQFASGYQGATLAPGLAGPTTQGASGAMGAGVTARSWAGYGAGVAAGVYGGRAISGDYSTGGSGNSNVNVGTAVGAIWGPIGAAVGGMIGGLVNRAFGRKNPEMTGAGVVGSIRGGGFSGEEFADYTQQGGWFKSDRSWSDRNPITSELDKFFDDASRSVLDQARTYGEALGLPADLLQNISTDIKVNLTGDVEANKEEIIKALTAYGDALAAGWADALKPLTLYGETTIQTIERVAGAILGVNNVLEQLGVTALESSVAGGQAANQLTDLFGGLQNLQQASSTYYQNFFTEEERRGDLLQQITESMSDVGLAVPATRDGFRSLVEGLDLTTESGQKQFATLMSLSEAFAQLIPVTDDLAASIAEAAESARRVLEEMASDRATLEVELLRAQGNTAGADTLQRSNELTALTAGVSAADKAAITAAYDHNEALKRQADIIKEATSLQEELLTLQGDITAIRAAQLAKLAPENRVLQEQINALHDQQSAQEELAALEKAERDRLAAMVGPARAETDAAFQALEKSVGAQKQLAEAARQAAEEQANALRNTASMLRREIDAIMEGTASGASAAAARQWISKAVASAQATGYLPENDELQRQIGVARSGLQRTGYTNEAEFLRDSYALANDLEKLGEMADEQIDAVELQREAANLLAQQLDADLKYAKEQIDELRGINAGVLSVHDAAIALYNAMRDENAISAGQVPTSLSDSAEASLPSYVGLNSLGTVENGGSGVLSAMDRMADKIAAIVVAVQSLQTSAETGLAAVASNSGTTARILEGWDGGDAVLTRAAT